MMLKQERNQLCNHQTVVQMMQELNPLLCAHSENRANTPVKTWGVVEKAKAWNRLELVDLPSESNLKIRLRVKMNGHR